MRILHVSTRLILGGSQENTVLSCEGQAQLGHEVHLAFGPIYGPEGSMLARVESFNQSHPGNPIRTHVVPDMIRAIHPLRDLKCLQQLKKLIRESQPDVVHTHSSKAGILGRAAAWACSPRPAIVHTIHGPPFHAYEKAWRNRVYIAAERYAAQRCHLIAGVCDAMCQQFKDAHIGSPDQYRVVYSGMDTGPYLDEHHPSFGRSREEVRTELGIAPSDFVVGTVARLAELKGHDDVLDALSEDIRENATKDRPLKLLWVGDGWWRERLEARIDELRLRDHVVLTGLVPSERIPELTRAMDVLLHPSYREGLPRTVPQALLSGVPVIATDVDGTREACIEGETGRLVPPGDAAAIRDAVRWMREHPAERRVMGERGRALCAEHFSAETMVRELERVYQEAVERTQSRP